MPGQCRATDRMDFSIAVPHRDPAPTPPLRAPVRTTPLLRQLLPRPKHWIWLFGVFTLAVAQANELEAVRAIMTRGDSVGALQRVEAAVTAQPGNAQLQFLRGVVLMDLARDAQALTVFKELHQLYPELPEPLNNIGLLQARAGQLELARQALQSALLADPGHRPSRLNLGQVHLMLAVQAWEQVASSSTPDPALLRRLQSARALLTPLAR